MSRAPVTSNNLNFEITGFHEDIAGLALDTLVYLYKKRNTMYNGCTFYTFIIDGITRGTTFLNEDHASVSDISKQCLHFYADIYRQTKGVPVDFNDKDSDKLLAYYFIVDNYNYKYVPLSANCTDDDCDKAYVASRLALGIYSMGNAGFRANIDNIFLSNLISSAGSEFFKIAGYTMNKIVLLVASIITDKSAVNIPGTACENDADIDTAISTWRPIISNLFQMSSFFLFRYGEVYKHANNDIKKCAERYIGELSKISDSALLYPDFTIGEFMRQFKAILNDDERTACKEIVAGSRILNQTNNLNTFNMRPFEYMFLDERPVAAYQFLEHYLKLVEKPSITTDQRGSTRRSVNWGGNNSNRPRGDSRANNGCVIARGSGQGLGLGDSRLDIGDGISVGRKTSAQSQTAALFLETVGTNRGAKITPRGVSVQPRHSNSSNRVRVQPQQSPSQRGTSSGAAMFLNTINPRR